MSLAFPSLQAEKSFASNNLECDEGQRDCGGGCVDTQSSSEHCGRFCIRCAAEATCSDGACVPIDSAGSGEPTNDGAGSQGETSGVCPDSRADPGSGEVFLYSDVDFGGACEAFQDNDENLADNTVGTNEVRSVKIGPGVRVMLCTESNYGGACSVLVRGFSYEDPVAGHYRNLEAFRVRDEQASVKVINGPNPEPNEVILYADANFAGAALYLGMGAELADLTKTILGDGGARSAKIGTEAVASLCEGLNFSGCESFSSDLPNVSGGSTLSRDQVMSARVEPR